MDYRTVDRDTDPVGVVLLGCGYVADFYAATLPHHPGIKLLGVWDTVPERREAFAAQWGTSVVTSFEAALADPAVEIIVNLTNPDSHYTVTKAALEAGKHVYSEKPLAMTFDEAEALVDLAEQRYLLLASAPCTLLGNTAQTLWSALRRGDIGRPRLAYAELDDGMIHLMPHTEWRSASGAVWPVEDEFTVGCTVEHSGYVLTWLTAFFGPITRVVTFAAELLPDKLPAAAARTPDFSCAMLCFASGMVARLTNSIVAPRDHSLRIIGDDGMLSVGDVFRFDEPVKLRRAITSSIEHGRIDYLSEVEDCPPAGPKDFFVRYTDTHDIDFARGLADLAQAIRSETKGRMDARHALHVLEVTMALAGGDRHPGVHEIRSTFDPILPWEVDAQAPPADR